MAESNTHSGGAPLLSDENRRRIVEEERARFEARMALEHGALSGAPGAPTPQPTAKTSTATWVIGALFAMLLVGFCAGPRTATQTSTPQKASPVVPSSAPAPSVGKEAHLSTGESSLILVARSPASFEALVDAAAAHDDYGYTQLMLADQVFPVDDKTRVLVLESGLTYTKVRILQGAYRGQAGYVFSEWVKAD